MLDPVHKALAIVSVHTTEATEIFTTLLALYLLQCGALKRSKRPHLATESGSHRPRTDQESKRDKK